MIEDDYEDNTIAIWKTLYDDYDDADDIIHITLIDKQISIHFTQKEWDAFLRSMGKLLWKGWKPSNN